MNILPRLAATVGLALVFATRTIGHWSGDRRAALAGMATVWAASPLLYYQTVNLDIPVRLTTNYKA